MRTGIIILFITSCLSSQAQKFEHYETDSFSLSAGDTIYFGEGSMGGQFRSVFMLWNNPPVKAPFNGGNNWLVIDHFRRRKENGIVRFYAVGYITHIKNVRVLVDVEGAVENGEVVLR